MPSGGRHGAVASSRQEQRINELHVDLNETLRRVRRGCLVRERIAQPATQVVQRRQRFRQRRLGETSPAPSGAQGPEGLLPPGGAARPSPSSTSAVSGSPSRRATAANAPVEKYNGKNRAYNRRSTVPKVNSTVRSAEFRPGPSSAAIEITVPWL